MCIRDRLNSCVNDSTNLFHVTLFASLLCYGYFIPCLLYTSALDTPAICCNGTYLYDYHAKTVLEADPMPVNKALQLIEMLNEHHIHGLMSVSYTHLSTPANLQVQNVVDHFQRQNVPRHCGKEHIAGGFGDHVN